MYNLRLQRKFLRNFFRKNHSFYPFQILSKKISAFSKKSARLSKNISTCPKKQYEEKKYIYSFLFGRCTRTSLAFVRTLLARLSKQRSTWPVENLGPFPKKSFCLFWTLRKKFRPSGNKILQGCQNCFIHVRNNIFGEKNSKNYRFVSVSVIELSAFWRRKFGSTLKGQFHLSIMTKIWEKKIGKPLKNNFPWTKTFWSFVANCSTGLSRKHFTRP